MSLPFALDLRAAGGHRFDLLAAPATGSRLLGAGMLAASVVGAAQSVGADRRPASLHVSFLRTARADQPCSVEVRELHEGRNASVREVSIAQADLPVLAGIVRFHAARDGAHWSRSESDPLPPGEGRARDAAIASMPILDRFEIRAAVPPESVDRPVLHPYWARARACSGDDPAAHAAVLAFLSDIGVSGSALAPGVRMRDRLAAVTLDHSLTWHAPGRVDRWVHVDARPVVNDDGRGVAHGEARDEHGRLLATFTQHVLLRPP